MGKNRQSEKYGKNEDGRAFIKAIAAGISLGMIVAWLFYRSVYAIILCIPSIIIAVFISKNSQIQKSKEQMREQFREAMRITADTLEAGFAVEQAFIQVEKELRVLYGDNEIMVCEIRHVNDCAKNNIPVETSLFELAEKMDDMDAINLTRILGYARKSGGNYVQITRSFVQHLDEKMETEKEIKANLAEKILEYKVMCVMPIGIMALLNLQSGDFMNVLYGNRMGVGIMTTLLMVYIAAVGLGFKILNIKM